VIRTTLAVGEITCADCHGNLNVGGGTIIVTATTTYAPGDTVDMSLKVKQEGQTSARPMSRLAGASSGPRRQSIPAR
jgi:hypothetical protein